MCSKKSLPKTTVRHPQHRKWRRIGSLQKHVEQLQLSTLRLKGVLLAMWQNEQTYELGKHMLTSALFDVTTIRHLSRNVKEWANSKWAITCQQRSHFHTLILRRHSCHVQQNGANMKLAAHAEHFWFLHGDYRETLRHMWGLQTHMMNNSHFPHQDYNIEVGKHMLNTTTVTFGQSGVLVAIWKMGTKKKWANTCWKLPLFHTVTIRRRFAVC